MVIAVERPDLTLTLVERRGRACDFLRRAVRTLGVADRVTVVEADLADLGHDPAWRASFPVATARGVGPPAMVAELVLPLVHPGGRLIASVAGEVDRWPDRGLAVLGAHVVARHDGLVIVQAGECPTRFPRRRRQPSVFDLGG